LAAVSDARVRNIPQSKQNRKLYYCYLFIPYHLQFLFYLHYSSYVFLYIHSIK